jgi:hypothetical protein
MPLTPIYWLDANVLITAKDGPFRFAVAPAFWAALDVQGKAGRLRIPKMVYDEVVRNGPDDQLAKWLKLRRGNGFCVTSSESVQQVFNRIADHVQSSFESHHAFDFLSVADPWVVAHAMESNGVVVTFENLQPGAKRVKIPNVCKSLGVRFMNLYDLLQTLRIKFT